MNSLKLSILIPSHARESSLESLLNSLVEFQNHPECEVIVVQNPKLNEKLQQKFPQTKFYSSERGSNFARTKAFEKSSGEWLWYIDDDCLAPSHITVTHIFALITSAFQEHEPIDGFAGVYLAGQNMNPLAKAYFIISDCWQQQCFKMGFPMLIGGNCLIRRSVIDSECWPTHIRFGGAELQLNLRVREKGLRIQINKNLSLIHNIEDQTETSLKQKAKLQAEGSHQIIHQQDKKLLFHPLIESTYFTHPLYAEASMSEKVKIKIGFELYRNTFRKQRQSMNSKPRLTVRLSELWRKLQILTILKSKGYL